MGSSGSAAGRLSTGRTGPAGGRKALVESVVLLCIGLIAMAEALRLIIFKDPYKVYDIIGPGLYLLALSVGLVIAGVCHFVGSYGRPDVLSARWMTRGEMRQLAAAIVVLLLYILLIHVTGYLGATLVFFLLDFRVSGVKSWRTGIVLALFLTAVYYLLFVSLCELPFPRGVFLE